MQKENVILRRFLQQLVNLDLVIEDFGSFGGPVDVVSGRPFVELGLDVDDV